METNKKESIPAKVMTLCGVAGCCPTVELSEKGALIKDDFGGKVVLNKDEWNDLVKKAEKIS
jgi:hypothetical protein